MTYTASDYQSESAMIRILFCGCEKEPEEVREMEQSVEMVEVLEEFVIETVNEFRTERRTSPEELVALAELVKAVNQTPRTLKTFN